MNLHYFKQFILLGLNLRRVDGAIVYLNGGELWRSNMPWGKVYWNSTSQKSTLTKEWSPGCCDVEWTYKECPVCHHNTTSLLRVFQNLRKLCTSFELNYLTI